MVFVWHYFCHPQTKLEVYTLQLIMPIWKCVHISKWVCFDKPRNCHESQCETFDTKMKTYITLISG